MKSNKSFAILLLLMLPYCLFSQTHREIEYQQETTPLRVLSWNIYMLPYISLFNKNAERAHLISERLKKSDYQIIVFQEAFSSKCRKILAQELQAQYPYQYGPANPNLVPMRTNSGLWIVSKLPLVQKEAIRFSQSKGFDRVARKGAVLFEGKAGNTTFQLLATHLQADEPHVIREAQCREIKEKLLNRYHKADIPQIICGDLNIDKNNTDEYGKMLKTLDAQNGELSGNVQITYDEEANYLARTARRKKRILDYVLIRNHSSIRKIERKVAPFATESAGSLSHLSDHYAIEANILFTAPKPENTASVK